MVQVASIINTLIFGGLIPVGKNTVQSHDT
jgi:hypothetical protein